jgi:hypothetical protein
MVLVFSSLFIVQFFVCGVEEGLSVPGVAGEYHEMLGTHLFGLLNVSQASLELVSGGGGSSPVFSV